MIPYHHLTVYVTCNPFLEMKKKYLLTMYDARTNPSKDIAERIRKRFGGEVFRAVIPRNIR